MRGANDPTGRHGHCGAVTPVNDAAASAVSKNWHQGQTDVIVNWFVQTCDEVRPSSFIAEVAVEQAAAELNCESSGDVTLPEEENREIAQGAPTARAT